jgi:hypothetical protein
LKILGKTILGDEAVEPVSTATRWPNVGADPSSANANECDVTDRDSEKDFIIDMNFPSTLGDAHRTEERVQEEENSEDRETEEEEEDDESYIETEEEEQSDDSDSNQDDDSHHQEEGESEAEEPVDEAGQREVRPQDRPPEEPQLRRSTRPKKPPEWFTSYFVGCLTDTVKTETCKEPVLFDASKYFK